MRKHELTEFGKKVKVELIHNNRSQTWLVEQVKEKSGKYFDGSYLHKLMTGERNAPIMVNCICEILNLSQTQGNTS